MREQKCLWTFEQEQDEQQKRRNHERKVNDREGRVSVAILIFVDVLEEGESLCYHKILGVDNAVTVSNQNGNQTLVRYNTE